ncbi:RYamide receptor-like [Tachypleus tridentatus]|uniref:RYamide receptor-like n=1 Tax=Tachypleus tridentatus TaxID=6853 RepID=UPI003FD1B681
MFPLHARITKRRTGLVITSIWCISLMVSIPFLIYRRFYSLQWKDFLESHCGESWPRKSEFDAELQLCVTSYPSKQLYYTFVTITLFFLPVVIMASAYFLIVWKLWISKLPGERNLANISVQHRAKKKVIKLVAVVLVAFVCCWMPFQVIVLYSQFGHSSSTSGELPKWFPAVTYFATYFAYSNSALNPIIYGGFCTNFRQGLCAVLLCKGSAPSLQRPVGSQKSRSTVTSAVALGSFHRRKFAGASRGGQMKFCTSTNMKLQNLTNKEKPIPRLSIRKNLKGHATTVELLSKDAKTSKTDML